MFLGYLNDIYDYVKENLKIMKKIEELIQELLNIKKKQESNKEYKLNL